VPNQPKTPKRSVRVPQDLWDAVKAKAKDRGESVTDVVIRALKLYLRD
jgi:predicted HicB family RNase H-like nuclease